MDNIQLAILIRRYEAALDDAIASAEANLPDDAKILRTPIIGKPWRECEALDDLRSLSNSLAKDAEKLERVALGTNTIQPAKYR